MSSPAEETPVPDIEATAVEITTAPKPTPDPPPVAMVAASTPQPAIIQPPQQPTVMYIVGQPAPAAVQPTNAGANTNVNVNVTNENTSSNNNTNTNRNRNFNAVGGDDWWDDCGGLSCCVCLFPPLILCILVPAMCGGRCKCYLWCLVVVAVFGSFLWAFILRILLAIF